MNRIHDQEEEANYFAMCLLMPESLVREWITKNGTAELTDDEFLKKLARVFGVSMTIASVRLNDLGLLNI